MHTHAQKAASRSNGDSCSALNGVCSSAVANAADVHLDVEVRIRLMLVAVCPPTLRAVRRVGGPGGSFSVCLVPVMLCFLLCSTRVLFF